MLNSLMFNTELSTITTSFSPFNDSTAQNNHDGPMGNKTSCVNDTPSNYSQEYTGEDDE